MLTHTNTHTDESLRARSWSNGFLCKYGTDVSPYGSTYLDLTTYTYYSLVRLHFSYLLIGVDDSVDMVIICL